jgi:carbon starvation protein
MFGVTNQTLSALALAIGTTIILRIGTKKIYALVTLIPCLFVTVVTFTAGVMNVQTYLAKGMLLNAWLSIGVIILVIIIIEENIRAWFRLIKTDKPIGMNDDRDVIYCPVIPKDAPPDARP